MFVILRDIPLFVTLRNVFVMNRLMFLRMLVMKFGLFGLIFNLFSTVRLFGLVFNLFASVRLFVIFMLLVLSLVILSLIWMFLKHASVIEHVPLLFVLLT